MRFPRLTGDASRRIHGLRQALRDRATTASQAADDASALGQDYLAASLRGKRKAYNEAAEMVLAVERGGRIPWNRGWRGKADR